MMTALPLMRSAYFETMSKKRLGHPTLDNNRRMSHSAPTRDYGMVGTVWRNESGTSFVEEERLVELESELDLGDEPLLLQTHHLLHVEDVHHGLGRGSTGRSRGRGGSRRTSSSTTARSTTARPRRRPSWRSSRSSSTTPPLRSSSPTLASSSGRNPSPRPRPRRRRRSPGSPDRAGPLVAAVGAGVAAEGAVAVVDAVDAVDAAGRKKTRTVLQLCTNHQTCTSKK